MIEAVGEEFWPTYFATLRRLLAPTGRIGLQAITMPHDRMLATRNTYTWIQKYIFPGGLIPSAEVIESDCAATAGRPARVRRGLRPHAAAVAGAVRSALQTRSPSSASTTCSGAPGTSTWRTPRPGFASGYLDVVQYVFAGRREVTTDRRGPGRRRSQRDRRRPAGPAAGLGRQRGRPGRRADAGHPRPAGAAPAAVEPERAGLARAYVTGEIDVEGDLADGLRRVWRLVRDREAGRGSEFGAAPTGCAPLGSPRGSASSGPAGRAAGCRPQLAGELHSQERDRAAIAPLRPVQRVLRAAARREHGLLVRVLDAPDDPRYALADAQRDKLDLICRKLGLRAGMRLLDVGCGWGSLTLYAAQALRRTRHRR